MDDHAFEQLSTTDLKLRLVDLPGQNQIEPTLVRIEEMLLPLMVKLESTEKEAAFWGSELFF